MSCKARHHMVGGSTLTSSFWSGETWRYEGVGENGSILFFFFKGPSSTDSDCNHEIKSHLFLGRKAVTNLHSVLKSRHHHFASKGPYRRRYDFSSSHVWM